YCNTAIRTITLDGGTPRVETPIPAGAISLPVAFGEDLAGELYVASLNGSIFRIVGSGDTAESQLETVGGQCLHAPAPAAGTGLLAWPCDGSPGQRRARRAGSLPRHPAPR